MYLRRRLGNCTVSRCTTATNDHYFFNAYSTFYSGLLAPSKWLHSHSLQGEADRSPSCRGGEGADDDGTRRNRRRHSGTRRRTSGCPKRNIHSHCPATGLVILGRENLSSPLPTVFSPAFRSAARRLSSFPDDVSARIDPGHSRVLLRVLQSNAVRRDNPSHARLAHRRPASPVVAALGM